MRTAEPCSNCSAATARCAATVVLPLPPFWDVMHDRFHVTAFGLVSSECSLIRPFVNHSENAKEKGSGKMTSWVPCGEDFDIGDVVRWTEGALPPFKRVQLIKEYSWVVEGGEGWPGSGLRPRRSSSSCERGRCPSPRGRW